MRATLSNRLAALVAAGATAAIVAIPAMAQDDADDAPNDAPIEHSQEDREAFRAQRQAHRQELLAAELGISVEELQTAMDNVHATLEAERLAELRERLDQRVADGDLTQEEADEIYAAAEAGEWPRRPGPGHGGPGHGGPGHGPRGGGFGPAGAGPDATPSGTAA